METFGNTFEDRQDLFDSQASMAELSVGMLVDFTKLWEKHNETISKKGFTDAYYDGVQTIADKYDVNYTHPKYRRGMMEVGNSTALH